MNDNANAGRAESGALASDFEAFKETLADLVKKFESTKHRRVVIGADGVAARIGAH